MAVYDEAVERGMLEVLEDARQEKRRAEQRRAQAERAIESAEQSIDAALRTVNNYRLKYGLAKIDADSADSRLAAELRGMNTLQVLFHWADRHDGTVVMSDAARFLAEMGMFSDERQAAGTLYPTIKRMSEFEHAGRGLYVRTTRLKAVGIDELSTRQTRRSAGSPQPTPMARIQPRAEPNDLEDLPF